MGLLARHASRQAPDGLNLPAHRPAPPAPPQAAADAPKPAAPRPKPSDRVALLKKALAGETAAAQAAAAVAQAATMQRPLLDAATCAADLAAAEDEEDAVSALFELSASVC